MTETILGRLQDLAPREAWPHEALGFTPWLSQHLDELSEVLGIPLELTGTEVKVESFSADVLARNPQDDSVVLIENQLETTDHTHLGQIMTYLAGLGAQTMVWIATDFREPHLSAIRWLNEHTVDPFAFFAIKLRVVRIGDSPLAPIFDVVERPNNWERHIQTVVRGREEMSEVGKFRQSFWDFFLKRHPDLAHPNGGSTALPNLWRDIPGTRATFGPYISKRGVGIFLRGIPPAEETPLVHDRLSAHASRIRAELGVALGERDNRFLLTQQEKLDMANQENWPEGADWLAERIRAYEAMIPGLLKEPMPEAR